MPTWGKRLVPTSLAGRIAIITSWLVRLSQSNGKETRRKPVVDDEFHTAASTVRVVVSNDAGIVAVVLEIDPSSYREMSRSRGIGNGSRGVDSRTYG